MDPARYSKSLSDLISRYTSVRFSRRGLSIAIGVLVALAALSSLLSVNTFPVIGNDSVIYIHHSRDLIGEGLVMHGFRQFGYPFILGAVRTMSDIVGAEPLLAMTVFQRGLLVLGAVLAFRFWGWWSAPILLLLFAPGTVAYPNLILTEGLAISLGLLLVFPATSLLSLMRRDPTAERRRTAVVLGLLILVLSLTLLSQRFTFAVFGLVPLVIAFAGWKTSYRRLTFGLFGLFLVLAGAFTLLLSLENRWEYGVLTPSLGTGYAAHFYAWNQVFRVEPANRTDPRLAEFFDDGVVYDFERELNAEGLSHPEREEEFRRETREMLEAAGMTVMESRLRSMAFALIGGRLHDVQVIVDGVVGSTRQDVDNWINRNAVAIGAGPRAFADRYNDGQLPDAVITDPIGMTLSFLNARVVLAVVLVVSLAVLVFALRYSTTRTVSLIGLGVVLASAIGLGWIWADNFRFLVTSSVFGVGVAVAVASQMWADAGRGRLTDRPHLGHGIHHSSASVANVDSWHRP